MLKKITHRETLIYYDGPVLFVGEDQINTNYLCLLVEQNKEKDKFFCVPISRGILNNFKLGELDLRNLYISPPTGEVYYLETDELIGEKLLLNPMPAQDIPESWIPAADFFYEEIRFDETIIQQANESNRAILHLTLNPPEARKANKISPENLAGMITIFHALVKYAFKNAISSLDKQIKKSLDISDNYKLDIVSASGGKSFNVHLQAKKYADLFGYADIERAFKIIDDLSENIENKERLLEKIKKHKGHFANAYIKLLGTIAKNDMPISYSWIMPGIVEVKTNTIYKHHAKSAYDSLISLEELTREKIEIIGRVIKADDKSGRWTLVSKEDKKDYRGELSEKSNVTLAGIVIKLKTYKFSCEETIVEITGTGREKKRLVLIDYEILE